MALRKGSAYTKRKARPYTRKSKKRSKSYIKTNSESNSYELSLIRTTFM